MSGFWDYLTKTAVLIALVTATASVIWYFVALDGRIKQLEGQLQALAISPTITRSSAGYYGSKSSDFQPYDYSQPIASVPDASLSDDEATITTPNPILNLCADLARRDASAYEKSASISITIGLESLMRQFGCSGLASAGKH